MPPCCGIPIVPCSCIPCIPIMPPCCLIIFCCCCGIPCTPIIFCCCCGMPCIPIIFCCCIPIMPPCDCPENAFMMLFAFCAWVGAAGCDCIACPNPSTPCDVSLDSKLPKPGSC